MSTHVQGFKAPDEKWKAMKAVYDVCQSSGTSLPKEVESFFNGEAPDDKGVEVDIEEIGAALEWSDDYRSGYEIDIKKLPKDMTHIRVYNSY